MELPSEVIVGPYRYAVLTDEMAVERARVKAEHAEVYGLLDSSATTITLDPAQSADCLADTLLHEVLHAVWRLVGLDDGPTERYEERVARAMAPTLLDTLRRNPELVKYLTRG